LIVKYIYNFKYLLLHNIQPNTIKILENSMLICSN